MKSPVIFSTGILRPVCLQLDEPQFPLGILIDITRACYALRPDGTNWPENDEGCRALSWNTLDCRQRYRS